MMFDARTQASFDYTLDRMNRNPYAVDTEAFIAYENRFNELAERETDGLEVVV